MTIATVMNYVVSTVTVNNSNIQDYTYPNDHILVACRVEDISCRIT